MAKARQQYFADEVTLQKESRDFAIQPELVEKLESIEAGAQVNVIETVKVNGEALTPDENKAVDVSVPLVEDTLYSTDPDKALSANQGKVLYEYIQNLASRGRYLSNWNTVTGLPTTNPVDNPYQYRAGDYYVVSNVAAEGGTNYRPNGSSYSWGVASTTVESEVVKVGDYYTYDGQYWLLLVNTAREIAVDSSLSTTSTNPVENRVVTNALNTKQNNIADLETIRSGAALGATALQPGDSLSELTGTSDDITQGTTNLFMTTAERSKLSNQSGVNTGDETQTTIKNKLGQVSASTDGYLTSTDWNTFNNKQGAISDLETIRSNASAGKSASDTIATYGDIVTHDADEFATAAQGAKADTALQSGDNVSELVNDAGYVTDAYHDNTKQDKLIAGANIQIAADGKTISATDTTYVAGDFDIKDLADSTGLRTEWSGKQDELIAGANIQIAADGKTISATDTTYTAGPGISISNNNVISNTQTSAEWGNITGTLSDQTDLQSALDDKQDTLIAGANIQIAQDGTISATDTTYTAGTGIDITNGVISNTQTSAEWGNISGTLSNQTDLQSALDAKQDDLIAGANIQIAADGKTISATDTTYVASDFDIKDLADSTGKRASWDAKQDAISDLATIRSNASTAIQPNDNVSALINDAGYITSADIPALDTAMSSTSTNGVQNKVIKNYVDTQVQEATSGAVSDTAYGSSWDGITGIAPSKNTVYDKISAMDTTIAGKQNTISDLATIRTGAGKGATAVQPGDNVSTLTNDAGFITKAVNDLTNYYTKSETYTKSEVADYVANFAGFKVVAQLPTTDIKTTIIYLLGPVGTGADKYEEYIYSNNNWIMIGDTSIDLSPYFHKTNDDSDDIIEGSTNLFLTPAERTKLGNTSGTNTGDETKASIQTKLGAASASNSGYLTSADWSTFNSKANASDIKNKVFPLPRQNDDISDIITLLDNGGSVTFYEPYSELATVVGYKYYTVVDYEQQSNVIKAEGEAATVSITLTYGTTTVASVTTEGGKVKKFSLSSTADTSTAQKIVEWYNLGGIPIILYNSNLYTFQLYEYSSQTGKTYYTFYADVNLSDGTSTSSLNNRKIMIEYNPNGIFHYSISDLNSSFATVLKTGIDYSTPYTPEYDGSPATKKYVDDGLSGKVDKLSAGTLDKAYIVNTSGTQTSYNVSQGVSGDAIVRRSGTQIIVPETPTDNTHAASKKYVDDTAFVQMQSAIITSASQPERATEGRLWYDMTNKLLKARDGSAWKVVTVDNTAYASSWNGDSTHSPSKDAVYDKISAMDTTIAGKQATLVSGTNIKTINNTSLLGSGNISITAGDMSYSDFNWQAKTGATITLDLASTYTPSANFTVNAPATIKDGQTYILRVNNESTAYTMTLGTNITNPFGTDITLTDYGIDQFVFLAIGGNLELQPEGGGGGGAITADTTGTETSISKIWVGTEAEYQALGTYEENVAYMTF